MQDTKQVIEEEDLLLPVMNPHVLQHCKSAMTSQSQVAQLAVLEQAKVIIIRHANSTFNKRWSDVEAEIEQGKNTNDAFLDVISDEQLLDCPLSSLGIEQCEQASPLSHQLVNIKTVLISPLRRALQTAHLLFKDHPNFSQIKFIVHPLLRENMHTVCDLPEDFKKIVLTEYSKKIPHLDLSEMEGCLQDERESGAPWYVHFLQEPARKKLIQACQESGGSEHHKQVVLEEILRTYPDRVESALNTHHRCENMKQYIADCLLNESLGAVGQDVIESSGPFQLPSHQIAIVGHSMYFTYMTATEWPICEDSVGYDFTKAPSKYRFLSNCEFYPFDQHLKMQSSTTNSTNSSPVTKDLGSSQTLNDQ